MESKPIASKVKRDQSYIFVIKYTMKKNKLFTSFTYIYIYTYIVAYIYICMQQHLIINYIKTTFGVKMRTREMKNKPSVSTWDFFARARARIDISRTSKCLLERCDIHEEGRKCHAERAENVVFA